MILEPLLENKSYFPFYVRFLWIIKIEINIYNSRTGVDNYKSTLLISPIFFTDKDIGVIYNYTVQRRSIYFCLNVYHFVQLVKYSFAQKTDIDWARSWGLQTWRRGWQPGAWIRDKNFSVRRPSFAGFVSPRAARSSSLLFTNETDITGCLLSAVK